MRHKDCCCFCFKARTGVTFLGVLLWIGLIISILSILIGSYFSGRLLWYYIPNAAILGTMAFKFCKLRRSERRMNRSDIEIRRNFLRSYFILVIVMLSIWSISS